MLTIVVRGTYTLRISGGISDDTAEALKAGTFFGHTAYVSITGRKP